MVPRGPPCRFPFPFLSFFFLRFSSPFCRSPCSPSLLLFRSFCPLVLSFSVCFLYRLLRFSLRFPAFPWWRILLLCFFILSRLFAPPPHALLATLKYAYSPCVLSSCVLDADLFFSSLASLFRFRFGHGLFRPVFFLWALCCLLGFGFCCDSFSKLYDI